MPTHELVCHSGRPGCLQATLCGDCLARAVTVAGRQADVIGQCWAERVCRGELRARATWPTRDDKTLAIARRLVASLATDPRLVEPLALACSEGAAAWWDRRPARYRL